MRGTLKKNGRTSTKMAPQMKPSGMVKVVCMYVRTPTGQTYTYSDATVRMCSNFKDEALALQTAAAYIAEMSKPMLC